MILVGPSRIHGQGVFAARDFDEGEQIGVYAGKRYSARQVTRRTWATGLTYVFGLSDGSVIDAANGGNSTKHLNHSCAPNCEAHEETGPNGAAHIVFYALRSIRAGEELLLDYCLVVDETEEPDAFGCSCGTTQCRGTMLAATP